MAWHCTPDNQLYELYTHSYTNIVVNKIDIYRVWHHYSCACGTIAGIHYSLRIWLWRHHQNRYRASETMGMMCIKIILWSSFIRGILIRSLEWISYSYIFCSSFISDLLVRLLIYIIMPQLLSVYHSKTTSNDIVHSWIRAWSYIAVMSYWARWHLESQSSRLFDQPTSELNPYTPLPVHYSDVMMSAMASRITGVSTAISASCSGTHQRLKAPHY